MLPDLEFLEFTLTAYDDPNFYAGNVSARILVRRGITLIGVAGSNDSKDWFQDACGFLVPRSGRGQIFDGFADMADESKEKFLSYIASFPAPYWIGGHSAGSPIATQWATWMAEAGMKPSFVQLLASPCTGDKDFASYYNSHAIPTISIGLSHDPVCEAYMSRCGVPVVPTLWIDEYGQAAQKSPHIIGAYTEHPGNHYMRAVRQYLKAG